MTSGCFENEEMKSFRLWLVEGFEKEKSKTSPFGRDSRRVEEVTARCPHWMAKHIFWTTLVPSTKTVYCPIGFGVPIPPISLSKRPNMFYTYRKWFENRTLILQLVSSNIKDLAHIRQVSESLFVRLKTGSRVFSFSVRFL